MEAKKEFEEADKKFDKMEDEARKKVQDLKSNIQMKKKIFMKISDVDVEDAIFFKDFCDRHTDGKQFLGIKVIRSILEFAEPLLREFDGRLLNIEARLDAMGQKSSVAVPKTQGDKK